MVNRDIKRRSKRVHRFHHNRPEIKHSQNKEVTDFVRQKTYKKNDKSTQQATGKIILRAFEFPCLNLLENSVIVIKEH